MVRDKSLRLLAGKILGSQTPSYVCNTQDIHAKYYTENTLFTVVEEPLCVRTANVSDIWGAAMCCVYRRISFSFNIHMLELLNDMKVFPSFFLYFFFK